LKELIGNNSIIKKIQSQIDLEDIGKR